VHEDEHLSASVGKGATGALRVVDIDRSRAAAEAHRDRERVAGVREVVAEDAVQDRERRLAPRSRDALTDQRSDASEGGVEFGPDEACHAADDAMDRCREEAGHSRERAPEHGWAASDALLHRLHDLADARGRLDDEANGAE
jgi:hypothetical protein